MTKLPRFQVTKLSSYQVSSLPIYQVNKKPSKQFNKLLSYYQDEKEKKVKENQSQTLSALRKFWEIVGRFWYVFFFFK